MQLQIQCLYAHELSRRRFEAINLYESLPHVEPFHASKAPERLCYGSNRAGKTLAPAIEIARAVTGQDPYDKYPKKDGRAIVLGYDLDHVARIMWSKLYGKGAFKIIRDAQSGLWRVWRPWELADLARKRDVRQSPSLIPHRLIESIAWEDRKANKPATVKLTNGWEIWCYSSKSDPKKGFDADLIWIDEEIQSGLWYPEMLARLLDRGGRLIWSATPEGATPQMYDVHERALEAKRHGEGHVEEFFFLLDANPYIEAEAKEIFKRQLENDPEKYRVKISGEWAFLGYIVFPEFNLLHVHGVDPFDIPLDWTRYVAIDPGRQITAALFCAVPPPTHKLAGSVYFYDELYVRQSDAAKFADQFHQKTTGQVFEAFIIDPGSAKVTEMGSGVNTMEWFVRAFAERDIESVSTGHSFLYGSTDKAGWHEAIRAWLRTDGDGVMKAKFFKGRTEKLRWEMEHYHHKRDPQTGEVTDKVTDKHDHLVWTLGALCSYNPQWRKHKKKRRKYGAYEVFLAMKKKKAKRRGGAFVQLGPPV